MAESDLLWVGVGLLLFGLVIFFLGFRWLRQKTLVQNTPTSKIRSIAMGLAEIYGEVIPAQEAVLKSPLTGKDCVYYKYAVEQYTQRGKSSGWQLVEGGEKSVEFFLRDNTGVVLVDPAGAEMDLPADYQAYQQPRGFSFSANIGGFGIGGAGGRMKYTEYLIEPKDKLYVIGNASDNPFVEEGTAKDSAADVMIERGGPIFLISAKGEKDVLSGFKWKIIGGLGGGVLLLLGGLAVIIKYYKML